MSHTKRALLAAMFAAALMLTGMQWSVQAQPPPPPQSVFGDVVPATVTDPDASKVELGTRFTTKTAGTVTAIRFYKGPQNTGTHVGKLYADGREVARVTFTNETATGWQVANLNAPVAIKPGVTYTTSYVALRGKYADDQNYPWPKVSGDLTATGGFYKPNEGYPTQQWNRSNYYVDVLFTANAPVPTTTTVIPPTTTTTPPPTTTAVPPSTTVPPTTTTTVPTTTTPPAPAAWPGVDNTGPATEPTEVYPNPPGGGRIALRDGDVIDGKIINNEVVVIGQNTAIRNSIVNGRIDSDCGTCSLTLENSVVNAGNWQGAAVGFQNLTIKRSEIRGGHASVLCSRNCLIEDSYLHDQVAQNDSHNAAFGNNGGGDITLRHNTLHCTPVDNGQGGGCTGDLAIHGDFEPLRNFLIERNLFPATPSGGYCVGLGWAPVKPFGADPQGIRMIDNVAQRGPNGKCGVWGPDTAYKPTGAGNEWRGNTWDDGTPWNHS